MANLDKETIEKLSRLCRIDCSEEEKISLLQDLQKILSYIEKLQEIDTTDVLPCNQVLEDLSNVMREDAIGELLDAEAFLSNAPSRIGRLIRVPPVLKPHKQL